MTEVTRWYRDALVRVYQEKKLTRLVVLALVVAIGFSVLSPSSFLSSVNFQTIAFSLPEIAILGIAMMIAMLTGGIDLSVVSAANLAALTVAWLFSITDTASATGGAAVGLTMLFILVGLATGLLAGAFNALLIAVVKITPILATLGTMLLYNGLAIVWTGGENYYGMPEAFLAIGNDSLFGVPISFLVLLAIGVAISLLVRRTALGTRLILIGDNSEAARYSGFALRRILTSTYLTTGLLAACAGIVMASRSASASADYGASYVLLAIVIAVLGGTNPDGGYGTVFGVLLAALVLQMMSSGFNIMRLSPFEYTVAQGVILIGVMVLDSVTWRRRRRTRNLKVPELQPTGTS